MCVLMCNFVSYFVCVILCIFVFLCDILRPSGVINDDYSMRHYNYLCTLKGLKGKCCVRTRTAVIIRSWKRALK